MQLLIIAGIMLLLGLIFLLVGEAKSMKRILRLGCCLITIVILGGILFFWWAGYDEDMDAKNKGLTITYSTYSKDKVY